MGAPPVATLPATRSVMKAGPDCSETASPSRRPSRSRATGLAKAPVRGSGRPSRSSPAADRGSKAGASGTASSVSMPSTRTATRLPSVAGVGVDFQHRAGQLHRRVGGHALEQASSKPRPRSVRSGSPLAARTADENSSSAELLIRCTE
jgi:hypothetical protein